MDDDIANLFCCCVVMAPQDDLSPIMLLAVQRALHQHEMKKCFMGTKKLSLAGWRAKKGLKYVLSKYYTARH